MSQVQHAAKNKQNLLVLINLITLTAYDDMLKLITNSTEGTSKFRSKLCLYLMIATVVFRANLCLVAYVAKGLGDLSDIASKVKADSIIIRTSKLIYISGTKLQIESSSAFSSM